ncbi:MAG TPA: hypothetical protein V6C81_13415 [Planktothrix sp.]|jgi:hypothetical protein
MKQLCFIIVNTEFSAAAVKDARILAVFDAVTQTSLSGDPFVDPEQLPHLEGGADHLHGSIILSRLRHLRPDAAFILIRAFKDNKVIRTGWVDGKIVSLGWTEYWLEAVKLCQERHYLSVTNLSFGGYPHAGDGGGWEAFQLSQATGPGKPGHVVLAPAGDGEGKAVHASCLLAPGQERTIEVWQSQDADFNFWSFDTQQWELEVFHNGRPRQAFAGVALAKNVWNDKQQVNFSAGPGGMTYLHVRRLPQDDGAPEARFDCWVNSGHARFHNHVDENLITEPAIFPHVIAVGLAGRRYGSAVRSKPNIWLAAADEAASFRLVEADVLAGDALLAKPERDQLAVLRALKRQLRSNNPERRR